MGWGVRGPIGRIEGSSKLLTVDLSHGRILAPELDSSLVVDISEGADLIGTGSRSKRTLDGPGMRGSAKILVRQDAKRMTRGRQAEQ